MEGSEAIARGRDRRGLPLLRRLSDDAVHRAARALRQAPARASAACASTPRASSRRSAWRGARSPPARAPRPARPARACRSCRSRSREITLRRAAARRVQHGARPGRLLPGDARRRSRRLPPHRARADRHRARRSSSRSSRSTSPTRWRNPVLVYGDYLLAHTSESVDVEPLDFGPLPAKDWAVDGSLGGSGPVAASCRRSASASTATTARASSATCARIADEARRDGARPRSGSRPASLDDAETVVVAFGSLGAFVRYVVQQLRAEGERVGFVRPITLWPFPSTAVARGGRGRATVAVFELNAGQMIDDVRLARARRARRSSASAGSRPTARASASGRCSTPRSSATGSWRCTAAEPTPSSRRCPTTSRRIDDASTSPLARARHERTARRPRARSATSSPTCCSPRSTTCAPAAASRSRCACCSRRSRSSASRSDAIARARDRLLHERSRATMDVDLVQALHGRAPSVATGVKRMRPDTLVFTLQGDGDMVNEGLQEVLHTAARGERVTCILLNNGVFGETGGHMTATTRDRPAHEELARRARRRVPRLPDPDRRPARAARGRRVRRARLACTTPARWRRRSGCCGGRSRRQLAGEGFSFVEILTMCPTGWFVPTAEGPDYMHDTLGEVHVMGELKVDGVVQDDRGAARGERRASSARWSRRSRRGGLDQ